MRRVSNWTGPARMDTMCRRYGGNPVSFLTIHLSIYAPVGSNRSQPTSQPKSFVRYRYCIPYQLSLLVMREKMRLLLLHPPIPYLRSITSRAQSAGSITCRIDNTLKLFTDKIRNLINSVVSSFFCLDTGGSKLWLKGGA